MSVRTIETRAIISAQDRSGNVFQAVARKIEGLDRAAKHAQGRLETITRSSGMTARAARNMEMAADVSARMSGLSGAITSAATAVASGVVARKIVEEGAKRVHERVRMEAAGMADSEIAEATRLAAQLSGEFRPIGQTETMHMLRNARAIVGSYQEAAEIMEPLMKLRVIAQANRPGQDVSEDFDQLVKGLEIKGVTQHPEQFRDYMEGIAKGLNVFGDTLKPYQYYEMFKYGRQATPGLSSDFILSTAPTLAQELGGSSYGNAVSGFNRAIVAGRMEHPSIKEMVRLGLLDRDDVDWLKSGEAKGIKSGHAIHGWQLAQSDPNAWVREYLLPAFEKMGISGADAMMREIGVLLSNRMAAQMVDLLATQQSRIDKDRALLHRAPGLAAAERYMTEDFSIAVQSFRTQFESALGAMGAPLANSLTPMINDAAKALAAFTQHVEEATVARSNGDRPEQQKLLQRAFNRVFFDVDSDQPYTEISQDDWRTRDLRQARERLTKDADPAEQRRLEKAQAKYRKQTSGPIIKLRPMERMEQDHSQEIARIEAARNQLRELDWSTLQRMLAEYKVRENADKIKAAREPWNRLDKHVTPTVPGSLAMPLSIGYGPVDRFTMSVGNHPRPAVAMPSENFRPPAPPLPQRMQVGFDTVKVEATFRVDAASSLLNVEATAKKAIAQTRAFSHGADTGPGGLGETATGQ